MDAGVRDRLNGPPACGDVGIPQQVASGVSGAEVHTLCLEAVCPREMRVYVLIGALGPRGEVTGGIGFRPEARLVIMEKKVQICFVVVACPSCIEVAGTAVDG